MRFPILVALLAAACSQEEPTAIGVRAGVFIGAGRNALCIAGDANAQRAGLIVYGDGDGNCSASGRVESARDGFVLIPAGEGDCRIPLAFANRSITIGPVPVACQYYCGSDIALEGTTFVRAQAATPVTDLAGDPLC